MFDNDIERRIRIADFTSSRWFTYSNYKAEDGYIKPIELTDYVEYCPWRRWNFDVPSSDTRPEEVPYIQLANIGLHLAEEFMSGISFQKLSSDYFQCIHSRILEWVNKNGPLGILFHQVVQASVSPANGTALGKVYTWEASRWVSRDSKGQGGYAFMRPEKLSGSWRRVRFPEERWCSFFPSIPSGSIKKHPFDAPDSRAFRDHYIEPIDDIVRHIIGFAHALTSAIPSSDGTKYTKALQELMKEIISNSSKPKGLANCAELSLPYLCSSTTVAFTHAKHETSLLSSPWLLGSLATMASLDCLLGGYRLAFCSSEKCRRLYRAGRTRMPSTGSPMPADINRDGLCSGNCRVSQSRLRAQRKRQPSVPPLQDDPNPPQKNDSPSQSNTSSKRSSRPKKKLPLKKTPKSNR